MKPSMLLVEANTIRLWTACLGFGKLPWRNPLKQYTAFTVGTLGFFQCELIQHSSNFSVIDDQLFRRVELFDLFGLFG